MSEILQTEKKIKCISTRTFKERANQFAEEKGDNNQKSIMWNCIAGLSTTQGELIDFATGARDPMKHLHHRAEKLRANRRLLLEEIFNLIEEINKSSSNIISSSQNYDFLERQTARPKVLQLA